MISPARKASAGANGIPNSRHTRNAQTPYSPPRTIWLRMKPAAADPTLRRKSIASSRFSGGVRSRPRLQDLVAVDRHEHREADDDDRVHERSRRPRTRRRTARPDVGEPLNRSVAIAGTWPRDRRGCRAVQPRLDVGEDRRRVPRSGRAVPPRAARANRRAATMTRTRIRAPIRITGTITAMTATGRGRRVRRRWSQSATGETRKASSHAKKKIRMRRK